MKNISLNFFGEEVSINMPTDLASLRQQISEKFMFSPSDAAEIVVSYAKDLGKKIIQTEQDFVTFISDKINKVDLDISQDSKLFQQNLKTLEKESQDNKKLLEEAMKKKEDIKKRKETALKNRKTEIKKLEDQIQKIKNEKKKLEQLSKKEEKQFCKQEKDIDKKINELQTKLGLNKNKLKSKKPSKTLSMIDDCLQSKNEEYKKLEEMSIGIVNKINSIVKKIIEHKLKKMHDFEKKLKEKKTELKPEEKQFFMNYPLFCNDIGRRVDGFSNHIQCETRKLVEDIRNAKKIQKEILCPKRKSIKKEKSIKKDEKKEKKEKKENKKVEKKIEKKEEEKHYFVECNGCKMFPIVGKRYKCETCCNFDFCEKCYEKEKEKHKHNFKTVQPIQFFKQYWESIKKIPNAEGKAIHHGYICDGCQMEPIIGNRYKCTICDDFDYCDACEEKFRDQHKHPFLKIYKPTMDPLNIKCSLSDPKENKK